MTLILKQVQVTKIITRVPFPITCPAAAACSMPFPCSQAHARQQRRANAPDAASFLFLYFSKKITKIYFPFHILHFYTPTARQGAVGTSM